MRLYRICIFMLIVGLVTVAISGCATETASGQHYSIADIVEVLNSKKYISQPAISKVSMYKYQEKDFLFNNHCFSFYRDMDYYSNFSARYDYLDAIIEEYPPQIVRTIENNGQKSMYLVYETDENTRLFVFFFETDNFLFTRGYPIIMKKTLFMKDFSSLSVGDSMKDVEKIDPITPLYRQGYNTLSDEMVRKIYIEGKERISSVHLLKDGVIRIDYDRAQNGDYIISQITISDDYIIPVLTGTLCYRIYQGDYVG